MKDFRVITYVQHTIPDSELDKLGRDFILKQGKETFASLTDEERLKVVSDYCHRCMTPTVKDRCFCWNDE